MYNVRCETGEETRRQTVTVTGDCDYDLTMSWVELSRDHEVVVDLKKENLTYSEYHKEEERLQYII